MKLNSREPNAHYDLAHGEPAVIERDNDGSTIYRYNITPEFAVPEHANGEEQGEAVQVGWQCCEIRIFDKPTKANLKKAVIRSVIDETAEFDLVNSYNKHVLGIVENEDAVTAYMEYLVFTEDLDAMLVADLGIR